MHEGHRQRMKERFLREGLDGFSDVQALELALFYAVPRKDTNPIAHALLDHFGSLPQVLEATAEELQKVPGMGENSAAFLRLITELGRFYQVKRNAGCSAVSTLEECAEYMVPYFFGRRVETVFLLCLDAKSKILCCKEVGEGSVNAAGISIRRIVETALGANASAAVLGHNHPSGIAIPSGDDIQVTCRIAEALAAVEVALVDHIVVADGDYVSMKQSGIRFQDIFV